MDFCPICGGEGFDSVDGHYYCFECGTQSQEHREEIVDEEEAFKDYTTLQTLKKKGVKRKADDSEEQDESIDVTYHEGWQMIYLALLDRMIDLGFNPCIKEAGRLLWFMYLNSVFKIQLDNYDFVDSFETRAVYSRLCSTKSPVQIHKNKFTRAKKPSQDSPCPHARVLETAVLSQRVLLVLLYFSSIFSGQFIPLHDLLSLVQSGKLHLPFDSTSVTSKSLTQVLVEYQNADQKVLRSVLLSHKVETIRSTLGIPVNRFPVDHVSLGNSLMEKMLLPSSLRPLLKRLLMLCHTVTLRYHKTLVSTVALRVMAAIIILLKLVYRLDDTFEHEQSRQGETLDQSKIDQDSGVYSWKAWVTMATKQQYTSLQTSFQPNFQDLAHLDDPSHYLTHCAEVLLRRPMEVSKLYFLEWEKKFRGSYGSYLSNKQTRKKKHKHQAATDKGSEEIIGTSSGQTTSSESNSMLNCSRKLFQVFGDKVEVFEATSTINPTLIPLDLSFPHLGGRACDRYRPISPSVSEFGVQRLVPEMGVSASQLFLLEFAAGLLQVPVITLANRVVYAEQCLREHGFLSNVTLQVLKDADEMADKPYSP